MYEKQFNKGIYIISYLLLSIFMFFTSNLRAQNTCNSAILLSNSQVVVTGAMQQDTVYWYTFTASSETIIAYANITNKSTLSPNHSLKLYQGTCLNYTLIAESDTNLIVESDDLIIGTNYLFKLQADSGELFTLRRWYNTISYFDDTYCVNMDACNMIMNGDFEQIHPIIDSPTVVVNGNTVTNYFHYHPFEKVLDYLNVISNTDYMKNLVCAWDDEHDTPQIKKDTLYGLPNHYALLGVNQTNTGVDDEQIKTSVKAYSGVDYILEYDYIVTKSFSAFPLHVKFGFRGSVMGIIHQSNHIDTLYGANTNWIHHIDTINLAHPISGGVKFSEMYIHPDIPNSSLNTIFKIDNVLFRPINKPANAIVKDEYLCPGVTDSIFQFRIENFDSLWTYFVFANNESYIINKDTFSLKIPYQSSTTVQLYVCGEYSTFSVYRCCDPFSASIPNRVYYCKDTMGGTQIINDKNISVCGWLHIADNANITISNSVLMMGQMSKISIGNNAVLILEGDTISAGCDYAWKGILSKSNNSNLNIQNCLIEDAILSVESVGNNPLKVLNSTFNKNQTGILIHNYNPSTLWHPDYTPPNSHNASITGCTFKYKGVNVNGLDLFLRVGVQVDTIFQITIGDDSSATQRNYFEDLVYGIKSTHSVMNVYNAEFKNIRHIYSNLIVDQFNKPYEGAIHHTTPLSPAYSPLLSKVKNRAIKNNVLVVGGDGLKPCEFDSCRIGVYAFYASVNAQHNQFNNQINNAIYLKRAFETELKYNTINMTPLFNYADPAVFQASIAVHNEMDTAAGVDIEVKDNTINVARTGISMIGCCSSGDNRPVKKIVSISGNTIQFSNYNPDDLQMKVYKGIKIQNCHRIRVVANAIEAVTKPSTSVSPRGMVGIHVAQSTQAWVSSNIWLKNLSAGIYVVGNCQNTQFNCNNLYYNNYGFYFHPWFTSSGQTSVATFITHQGNSNRASDNQWYENAGASYNYRVGGNLNISSYQPKWYFRGGGAKSNRYSPDINYPSYSIYSDIFSVPDTDRDIGCEAIEMDPVDMSFDEIGGLMRRQLLGDIVMDQIDYLVLDEEFEYFDHEYLYELLYNNPEVMNLGEPDDTAYINFYNYFSNSSIQELINVEELINMDDLNQAMMENGAIVATNVIEANKKLVNDVYLNSWAYNREISEAQHTDLLAVAMLTPYVGGSAVYTARVMLGVEPEDYNLAYRKGEFADSLKLESDNNVIVFPNPTNNILTFELIESKESIAAIRIYDVSGRLVAGSKESASRSNTILVKELEAGIYFYHVQLSNNSIETGKFIKTN